MNIFIFKDLRLERFERSTYCLEGSCSIQLSYRRISNSQNNLNTSAKAKTLNYKH